MIENMERKPLVSAIVIFFNAGEKFFVEAIESIFAQTYDNWELLLADDGSTDESTAVALRYAQQYPEKVRYIEHENHQNRGMSATRNLGISHAKGEYIAFLDADDVWLPHKLEQQLPILESYPEAAMLYGRTQFWFSWMENNPALWTLRPEDKPGDLMTITSAQFDTLVKPPTQLLLFLQNKDIYPCTCSILIRRQVFEQIGKFEEGFRNAHEDMVFHSKVFLKAPVYVSSEYWDRYRMHSDSYWRQADRQGIGRETRWIGRFNYLVWLKSYLIEKDIKDPEVWQELNKALTPYRYKALYRLKEMARDWLMQMEKPAELISKQLIPAPIRSFLEDYLRLIIIQNSVKHISGVKDINCLTNELVVLCIVRNGEFEIKKFIEHYLSLGAKHIVLLDNESSDRTIALASRYDNTTILQTKYKPPIYQDALKTYLIEFIKNQPHLLVEIDELIEIKSV